MTTKLWAIMGIVACLIIGLIAWEVCKAPATNDFAAEPNANKAQEQQLQSRWDTMMAELMSPGAPPDANFPLKSGKDWESRIAFLEARVCKLEMLCHIDAPLGYFYDPNEGLRPAKEADFSFPQIDWQPCDPVKLEDE
jgi:hypothetical protein